MAHARGRILIDLLAFVRDYYGSDGLRRVLADLAPDVRATFARAIRESDWYPLSHAVAYRAAMKKVLAPNEPLFHRRVGRYAGLRQRSALGSMLAPEVRVRLAPTIWRMFYDEGSLRVVGDSGHLVTQIHDFPAAPELCESFLGSWESVASTEDPLAVVTQPRCKLRGDPYCEFVVR